MPPIKKHAQLSLKRTGKEYDELHSWMDGNVSSEERAARHNILNIPGFLPIIEKKFGKDSVKEYLWHIKDDYEKNIIFKVVKRLKKIKFW